ncbi:MAG: Plug domain-containing protein, partial [Bacteroidales bacterium]|nr:Plug domain-containing protein [Bacteroidales bacterium]
MKLLCFLNLFFQRTNHKINIYIYLIKDYNQKVNCGSIYILYTIILSWVTQTGFTQSKLDSIQYLKTVEVIGNSYKEVIPSQKLSGKELEALNSFSVADAIRYFSGIQIKDYGGVGGLKTVDIRSMGTNHMGVFYDGIQLGNAQNGQIDLGKFSLDNIEEISLYNGQKSEIFQSAKDFGSAGTLYIKTRIPHFLKGENTTLVGTYRTGSFGLVNPSILWEQKINKKISSSFNIEFTNATGKYPFRYKKVFQNGIVAWDTTAIRQNGDIQALRIEESLHGYLIQGKWQAKAYFYDSEKGIPGAIVNNIWKRSQRQWDRNFFLQSSFQKRLITAYDLLVNIKYANDWMHYLNPDTTLMYIDNKFQQQEIYASIANKYSISPSNPQPIGFSGILLAKRQNSFYCTYSLYNRNIADTKSPYPIKR